MIRIRIGVFTFFIFSICSVNASSNFVDPHGFWPINWHESCITEMGISHPSNKITEEEIADSIRFSYPISSTVVKRKTPIIIRWVGGNPDNTYYLELYSKGIYIKQIAVLDNIGEFNWEVPKEINGGKEFQFRLVNSRFFGDFTFSKPFQIRNRIPRAFWIVPGVAAAGGIYLLIKLISDGGGKEEQDLPGPIDPN